MDIKKLFETYSGKANSPEAERVFRNTCSLYEKQCSALNQPLSQAYQEYLNHYYRITSLYLTKEENKKTKLVIYDTESGKEEEITLNTSEPLSYGTCIVQLPNGDLFCSGIDSSTSGTALIIDRNYEVRVLPSGAPYWLSSGIYFNGNVYCFGGYRFDDDFNAFFHASKFNLHENRWINLNPIPHFDCDCQIDIFNRNILISSSASKNLLLYSIDIDSYSIIDYEFISSSRKILINAERLYLIECSEIGLIYESEDNYNWKKISNSIINRNPLQLYCSYNKGGVNISARNQAGKYFYYKFDLSTKTLVKLKQ